MSKHTELRARLEAAEVGSYTLDAEIWDIEDSRPRHDLGEEYPIYKRCLDDSVAFDNPPPYTTSLDAALALANRVLANRGPIDLTIMGSAEVGISSNDPCGEPLASSVFGKTPALALCAAILRALDAQEGA